MTEEGVVTASVSVKVALLQPLGLVETAAIHLPSVTAKGVMLQNTTNRTADVLTMNPPLSGVGRLSA